MAVSDQLSTISAADASMLSRCKQLNALERFLQLSSGQMRCDTWHGECTGAFGGHSPPDVTYCYGSEAAVTLAQDEKCVSPNKMESSSDGQISVSIGLIRAVFALSSPGSASGSPINSATCWAKAFRAARKNHENGANPGADIILAGPYW